ncbi:class A beta-lactamase-related serine hydrolase [Solimonas sp. K1W22B-7]|uniref:serine hydrolase domain-containing protein n=1 Tax=Solimonas sp. K1W22B-7 TaxID=2303331 RepID=UPI000E330D7E|nr:serine hydrolase domain-containing protein [Solimonas sp. K1W22B-7]AXQ30510.1 class A beta-lactamase-related serine hydrolase [Solimonas sp. K1W22B-7]
MPASNRIAVPPDLSDVTCYDPREECRPQDAGLAPGAVASIWSAVESLYRTGLHPGIVLAVRYRGQLILNRAIGHSSGNAPGEHGRTRTVLTPQSPICLFSASKAITAMLALRQVELGRLRLDVPVADYLPEYAAHGKGRATLAELLSHRGGLPRLPVKELDPALLYDWNAMLRLICAARPQLVHGRRQAYHAVTAGFVVGEIVQRVSGRRLPQLLREQFAEPLGCRYLSYGLAPDQREHYARNAYTGPLPPFPLDRLARRALGRDAQDFAALANRDDFLSAVLPAVNICCTADECSRFFQMLLDGGTWNGRRLLQPETIASAVRPAGRVQLDGTLMLPLRFSPGFMLGTRPFGLYGADCEQAFGHLGYMSVLCWADPKRQVSAALLTTGKSVAPAGLAGLWRVPRTIERHCPPAAAARGRRTLAAEAA